MPPPLLLLKDISLTCGATPLLSGAELAVAAGDRICLAGRNLRAVQPLLGHTKLESTVRYLGIEVDDALSISEQVELRTDYRGRGGARCGAAFLFSDGAPHTHQRPLPRQRPAIRHHGRKRRGRVATCPWHSGFPPSAIRSHSGPSTTFPRVGARRLGRAGSDLQQDAITSHFGHQAEPIAMAAR
jgi:hypothetical protein